MPSSRLLKTIRDRDGFPIDVTQHAGDDLAATITVSRDGTLELTTEQAIDLAAALLFATDTKTRTARPDVVKAAETWGVVFLAVRTERRPDRVLGGIVDVLDPASVIIRTPGGK